VRDGAPPPPRPLVAQCTAIGRRCVKGQCLCGTKLCSTSFDGHRRTKRHLIFRAKRVAKPEAQENVKPDFKLRLVRQWWHWLARRRR
jgi:hypothetical protein